MSRRPVAAFAAVLAALALTLTGAAGASAGGPARPKPTIVFVHGAFADASGFSASIGSLQKKGYTVYAPANPLRGLYGDADYLRTFLATIPGPIVLVGHSYGGAVITNAATGNPNVKALVYVAAFAQDEGETALATMQLGGGTSDLMSALVLRPYPGAPVIDFPAPGDRDQDGYIDPAKFRAVFAADLPAGRTAVLAASQRPGTLSSLGTPSGVPAWRTIPSWYLVANQDRAIPPQAEAAMAARMHARTVRVDSSHVAMMSHPAAVTALVLSAATAH